MQPSGPASLGRRTRFRPCAAASTGDGIDSIIVRRAMTGSKFLAGCRTTRASVAVSRLSDAHRPHRRAQGPQKCSISFDTPFRLLQETPASAVDGGDATPSLSPCSVLLLVLQQAPRLLSLGVRHALRVSLCFQPRLVRLQQ